MNKHTFIEKIFFTYSSIDGLNYKPHCMLHFVFYLGSGGILYCLSTAGGIHFIILQLGLLF